MAKWVELKGDILNDLSEAIVNPVNCEGVMGKGLALQYKERYPEMYKAYRLACKRGEVEPGKIHVYRIPDADRPLYILNFPTKDKWREPSKMIYIQDGLCDLRMLIDSYRIRSIAIPPLGCGLGGLPYERVQRLIRGLLDGVENLRVTLYLPW